MAMTKKEQAEMQRLRDELLLAKALRFTEEVQPDVQPPGHFSGEKLRKGWLFNDHNDAVSRACTSSGGHSFYSDDGTTTQGARPLYSTKLLALKALRAKVEWQVAARLADIDRRIAEEEA